MIWSGDHLHVGSQHAGVMSGDGVRQVMVLTGGCQECEGWRKEEGGDQEMVDKLEHCWTGPAFDIQKV